MKLTISRKIIWLITLTLTALAFTPRLLLAAEPKLDNLKISVMAEYDDPRVLAVFEAKMSPDTKLPLEARFVVPKSAADPQIGMACEVPEGQGHNCKVYNTSDKGQYTDVTYKVEQSRNLFWEYYWDPFKGKVGDKSFKFDYVPAYDVKHLEIQVVEPKTATGFKLTPAAQGAATTNEGLKTHSYTFENVKKDKPITINASYVKNDNALSVAKQPQGGNVGDDGAAQNQAGSRGQMTTVLILALMIIGGGAALGVWRLRTTEAGPASRPARARPVAARKGSKKSGSKGKKAAYCSECGHKLSGTDKFCPGCGSKL